MSSIRKFLIIVLLSAITLVNFLSALHGYRTSMKAADKLFDEKLIQMAQLINQHFLIDTSQFSPSFPEDFQPTFSEPSVNQKPISSNSNSTLLFQVWNNGTLIAKSPNAPNSSIAMLDNQYHDINVNGYRWRALSKRYSNQDDLNQGIIVAERTDVRFTLAESIIVESILPIIACLPLIGLIIWLVVGQGLKPILDLANQLSRKRSDDLSPIIEKTSTKELSKLVDSANNLLARLDDAFQREKRFASNAAHELRTPLSILRIHLYNLQQETETPNINIDELEEGVSRLEHLVEQILVLHRSTNETYLSQAKSIQLFSLAKECIVNCYSRIDKKKQQIELDGDENATVNGDHFALSAMLSNLIDNASKYTPENGKINVLIKTVDENIHLIIEDTGPGIPESDYQQVFERFYRVGADQHDSGEEGCGLGLSIVKHIADLHNASITLKRSKDLGGLSVDVTLFSSKNSTKAQYDAVI